ncbi:MAG: hypothetical protein KGM49_10730 [Sphingomonadales bacterium]|nr:hypothetical protein [Sphingomonadales bacterium]
MRAASLLVLGAMLALAACHKADTAPGPGGVTVGEARALDDAAQMIEDQRLTHDAIPAPVAPAGASSKTSASAAPKAAPTPASR